MSRLAVLVLSILALVVIGPSIAAAQGINLDTLLPAGETTVSGRMVQIILVVTVLSVAPGLLMMVTCFTRFVIVLSLLRAGMGLQTTPANLILISLALFMTFYVMAPTFDKAWQNGLKPFIENKISEEEAYTQITQPLREFMRANVRPKDLELFRGSRGGALSDQAGRRARGGNRAQNPHPGIHDFRAPARFRDGLSRRIAVSRHRHDRRDTDDVDGHDDAAADGHVAAFQNSFLRADRRLESIDRRTRPLISLIRHSFRSRSLMSVRPSGVWAVAVASR